jgi:Coenzyme PQQ synthesis protein D (PqqD)
MAFIRRHSPVRHEGARASGSGAHFLRATLTRPLHVVSTTQGGQTVVLDPLRGRYHTLNEVGGVVWGLLATGATLDEIVHAIHAEYDVPPETSSDIVRRDVTALLIALDAARLLAVVPPARRRR